MNNLTSQRFGRLTALKDSGKRDRDGHIFWECICDCGQKMVVRSNSLCADSTKSCGCLYKEKMFGNKFGLKHGETCGGSIPKLYMVLANMKERCSNSNNADFKYYGRKDVSVCPEWKNDYLAFKNWALANGYEKGLTIDRIDNDGNYEPSNCQFITRSENIRKEKKRT